ncbi:MAG TPA: OsmC family protein [Cytophagaceae bacterium]|nr:OsmC family protein [Cytophagaceae bacterium]
MTNLYLGELRTEGIHLLSGNKIITDAPLDNNGKGEAYSPTDLVCSALSSCMVTTMGIVAAKENIDLVGMSTEITKIMTSNPRRIAEIIIHVTLPEKKILALSDHHKELLKKTARNCPVALSLHPDIKQILRFNF